MTEKEFVRRRSLELDEVLRVLNNWGFSPRKVEKKVEKIESERHEHKVVIEGPGRLGGSIEFSPRMFKEAVRFDPNSNSGESAIPYIHIELRPGESAEFRKNGTFCTCPVKEVPRYPDSSRVRVQANALYSGKERAFPCVADAGFKLDGNPRILMAMEIARELGISWDEEAGKLIEVSKKHIVELFGKDENPIEIDYEFSNNLVDFEKKASLKTWIVDGWEIPLKGRLAILTAAAVNTLEIPVNEITKNDVKEFG